jgi:hypothetical protein
MAGIVERTIKVDHIAEAYRMSFTVRLVQGLVVGLALAGCGDPSSIAERNLRAMLAEDSTLSDAERADILVGAQTLLANGTCSEIRFAKSAAPEIAGVYWVGCEGLRYHAFRVSSGQAEFCGSSAAECACGPGRAITGFGADGRAMCEP